MHFLRYPKDREPMLLRNEKSNHRDVPMVIILGLPRSGTTMLGRLLGETNSLKYEEEPNVIWRYQNFRKYGHDQYTSKDATAEVTHFIRSYFKSSLSNTNAKAVLEKTPSNALRPEFVRSIFPKAKFIILRREVSAIEKSIVKKVQLGVDGNTKHLGEQTTFRDIKAKMIKFLKIPQQDLSAYIPQICSNISFGLMFPHQQFWGPRQIGWRETLDLPLEERVRNQCAEMSRTLDSFVVSTNASFFETSYERLRSNTDEELVAIEDYLDLPESSLERAFVH